MTRTWTWIRNGYGVFRVLLMTATMLAGTMFGQEEVTAPPPVCEGELLYRSPVSGRYETVALVHTDAVFDVRGLVASATVTQQYENSTSAAIEAVYVFPLPHDAAVYDMEIHVGNRVIRSKVKEREEAKKVYEAAKSAGQTRGFSGGREAEHLHRLGRKHYAGRPH